MAPEFYNSLGAMHGTIMIFLGIVPVAFAAFGNFVVPLQIGAPDMTFPKINMASYWVFVLGGIVMLVSFFVPGGAAKSGWTAYTPLSVIADKGPNYHWFWNGQNLWLIGFVFLITSSLLGAVNFITTIIQLRAKGSPGCASVFRLDAVHHRVFAPLAFRRWKPRGDAADGSHGGDELLHAVGPGREWRAADDQRRRQFLLWQHLFWFLGHPEVYVLILPRWASC
jgi:cytochrome c oxidase subunit 1